MNFLNKFYHVPTKTISDNFFSLFYMIWFDLIWWQYPTDVHSFPLKRAIAASVLIISKCLSGLENSVNDSVLDKMMSLENWERKSMNKITQIECIDAIDQTNFIVD